MGSASTSNHQNDGFLDKLKRQLEREFLSIEKNPDLTPDEKVKKLVWTTSLLCAGVAIQPIPFADMPILTSIQAFMGYKIAQVRGVDLRKESITEIIKYIGGCLGLGFSAQHIAIAIWKTGIPGFGGLLTIPIVAGLTMGIGYAMDLYFKAKAAGRVPTKEEIREAFNIGRREGKKIKREDVERYREERQGDD